MFDSTRKHRGLVKKAAVLASTTALAVGMGFLGAVPANASTSWGVAGPSNVSCGGTGTASTNSTQVTSNTGCTTVQAFLTYQNGSSSITVNGTRQANVSVASCGSTATSHWGTIWINSTSATQYFD